MLRRSFIAAACGALAWGLAAGEAAAQSKPVTIRLGHVLSDSHSWHVAAKGFAEQVARETQGRVNIQVFSGGQLGSEREVVEGLQIGTVQAGVIGSGSFQPIEPKMGIVELPYAWPTREKAFAAFDGELGAALDKLLLSKNIVVLSWWENGYRHVTNNKLPINKPDDLKGLKIRVTPDKVRLDTFVALGAEPAPLAFGELYSALQQGVFDAQEKPHSIIYGSSFFEVQKYLSLTGHVWGAACLVVSQSVWDRIGPDDQKIVRAAAAKWRDEQRRMITESDADFIQKLEGKGMAVNKVDTAPFVAAVQPVWKSQEAVYGPELMSLLNKYRQ
jgi:tripartite ATP-independent transporter DctP family solute receptor